MEYKLQTIIKIMLKTSMEV